MVKKKEVNLKLDNEQMRKELIQVAAVTVAIIQDMDLGSTHLDTVSKVMHQGEIMAEVSEERFKQLEKWGDQSHAPYEWFTILLEEFAEVAGEIHNSHGPPDSEDGAWYLLRQVASLELPARLWLQGHEWSEPKHKEVHEGERDSE